MTGKDLGDLCGRKVYVRTTVIYRAVPEGMDDEIVVAGNGWTPYWSGGDYPTSMGWYPEYDVPIGPVRAVAGRPVQGDCTGVICHMASGQDDRGAHMWIGCSSCGWTRRQRLPEPVTASLFEEV